MIASSNLFKLHFPSLRCCNKFEPSFAQVFEG